jgi:hypothetical protein
MCDVSSRHCHAVDECGCGDEGVQLCDPGWDVQDGCALRDLLIDGQDSAREGGKDMTCEPTSKYSRLQWVATFKLKNPQLQLQDRD